MAAESSYIKTNISGTIVLSDGTGTPVTLTLAYERGDLAISPLQEKLNELVTTGRLDPKEVRAIRQLAENLAL